MNWKTILLAVFVSAALGFLLVTFGAHELGVYGWGVFVGVPFLMGFVCSWILNYYTSHSLFMSICFAIVSTVVLAVLLLGLPIEGLICIAMALPIALPFVILGAVIARYLLERKNRQYSPSLFAACLALVPLTIVGEYTAKPEPPITSVTTSVVIEAPVSTVWKNVLSFPALASPDDWLFQTGIAYPESAVIVGSGVGATRYCRFSTGDFVEPITTWNENHLLAFDVSAQPPAMVELSPWNLSPHHLRENYMRSRRGQFRLIALNDRRTLLEGTTWYQDYFWPQPYWHAWSNFIVHRIHNRVLQHIKLLSERK
ncbi:MAG TPA: hypothetical protein VF135_06095 [Terriglobales bacterium]